MLFVKVIDGVAKGRPVTERYVRSELSKTHSLPADLDGADLTHLGWHAVDITPAPDAEPLCKVELDVPVLVKKKWVRTFRQTPLSEAEIAVGWEAARGKRNDLLAASDWTQAADNGRSKGWVEKWRTYRQALRDVTDQADPFRIEWPQAPS